MRAIRAKAKFCAHFEIEWDHSIPLKVKAVVEAREPESISEVRSFLGLVNYSGRFIPDLARLRLKRRVLSSNGDQDRQKRFRSYKMN